MLARPSFRRRLSALIAVPLMILGMVVVVPGAASAAKWYCNPRCDSKDPALYPPGGPCANDAVTVSTFTYGGRTLQLRYSNNCETAWGRLYGGQDNDKVVLVRNAGNLEWEYWKGNQQWTDMLDNHNQLVKACLQPDWATNTRWGCTAAY